VDEQCSVIEASGRWRTIRTFDAAGPVGTLASTGRSVTSFASNDYLGLSQHPAVKAAAIEAIERWGTGSGASRLIVGGRSLHDDLEREVAEWRDYPAALLFPTGYAANLGVLSALAGPGVRICADALNHASLIDGCRLARQRGADVCVYEHLDLEHLEGQLVGAERAVVVSDSVFSMDGDTAPIGDLAGVCARHDALLVLDDAHAVIDTQPVDHDVTAVRIGTLSKALGSLGGYVAAPRRFIDLFVNSARPFIFTTAPSPADTAAALASLRIVRGDEGDQLRRRLTEHVAALKAGHPTPILPVVVGDEEPAMAASAALLDAGLLVPAIRPPTVPEGTCRLRIAVSAAHTSEQIERLRATLAALDLLP
jgi:8-amino-7-oxononanoate synthase